MAQASLTLRSVKGSPLTNNEVDGNFSALNTELSNANILASVKAVDGVGSGLDSDLLQGSTKAQVIADAAGESQADAIALAIALG